MKNNIVPINHFDPIGIPTYEDIIKQYGSAEKWQKDASEQWIQKLISSKEPLIILEGSFNPEFVVNAMKWYNKDNYLIFCIHTDQKIREARLVTMPNQPKLVTQDMKNFAQFLKKRQKKLVV